MDAQVLSRAGGKSKSKATSGVVSGSEAGAGGAGSGDEPTCEAADESCSAVYVVKLTPNWASAAAFTGEPIHSPRAVMSFIAIAIRSR